MDEILREKTWELTEKFGVGVGHSLYEDELIISILTNNYIIESQVMIEFLEYGSLLTKEEDLENQIVYYTYKLNNKGDN